MADPIKYRFVWKDGYIDYQWMFPEYSFWIRYHYSIDSMIDWQINDPGFQGERLNTSIHTFLKYELEDGSSEFREQ